MTELTVEDIGPFSAGLRELGIKGVDRHEAELRRRSGDAPSMNDLAREGLVAASLRKVGLGVTMRDRPDLRVDHAESTFLVEVVRFRERADDQRDRRRLASYRDLLEGYGSTSASAPQVLRKIIQKANRYGETSLPLVLAIYSDSEFQIEQVECYLAVGEYRRRRIVTPLAGVLCLTGDPPINQPGKRNVGFYGVESSRALSEPALSTLHDLRERARISDVLLPLGKPR